MSKPYTTQTITGYNSTAPADDGSQVSTNEIKWSNHKTKLGDPIKTLAEAMNTELLSAFGLVFGQNISSHATDYTVVAGDQGKFLDVTGTTTITLLAAATAGANFALAIINNGTGVVTVDGNGAETINGAATITLSPGNSIILTCNATLWVGPTISGVNKPSFSVHLNEVAQLNITGIDKIEWTTAEFDTNSDWDLTTNYRYTPTIAGKYMLSACVSFYNLAAGQLELYIYKNGAAYKQTSREVGVLRESATLTVVVDANGSTDYFEVFAQVSANDTADVDGEILQTYFTGCKID